MENAMVYIGIVTFFLTMAKCLVMNPLGKSIEDLRLAVDSLECCIKVLEKNIVEQNVRITRVEESSSSGHKRLDRLECLLDKERKS